MNNTKDLETSATHFLDKKAVPYHVFQHSGKVHGVEQAAKERGQVPNQIVKSILFRIHHDQFFMVLIPGPCQIAWKALRRHFGTSRLTLAKENEVLSITGYRIGAVSPFGINQELNILIDNKVFQHEVISLGSGKRGSAIIMKSKHLLIAIPNYQLGDFANSK